MNSFGNKFRISLFGESHGILIGVTVDGVPAGIPLVASDFEADLARRRSGAKGTTLRKEEDIPELVSGVCDGYTTGAPLTIVFRNNNTRSGDYSSFREIPRPGHADYTAAVKYNSFNDIRGGGHFSGRITLCLVAAGTVAKKMLKDITIEAHISELGGIPECQGKDNGGWDRVLQDAISAGDSIGGVITCTCTGVPAGLGDPFFESLESKIAHLIFSIPGTRGVEFGDGFRASAMRGSQHNDPITDKDGHTSSNGAGGINGGISNGNPIVFRTAIKPTSSISCEQRSFNFRTGEMENFSVKGRHDACIALRCPVIIEAAAAIALADC